MTDPLLLFKCFADTTRLKSLILLQLEGELCVCELMAALEEIQPKVSRHLALLRRHGIVLDRRQGQWIYYRLNPDLPDWAANLLAETARANSSYVAIDRARLCRMGGRPERMRSCC